MTWLPSLPSEERVTSLSKSLSMISQPSPRNSFLSFDLPEIRTTHWHGREVSPPRPRPRSQPLPILIAQPFIPFAPLHHHPLTSVVPVPLPPRPLAPSYSRHLTLSPPRPLGTQHSDDAGGDGIHSNCPFSKYMRDTRSSSTTHLRGTRYSRRAHVSTQNNDLLESLP